MTAIVVPSKWQIENKQHHVHEKMTLDKMRPGNQNEPCELVPSPEHKPLLSFQHSCYVLCMLDAGLEVICETQTHTVKRSSCSPFTEGVQHETVPSDTQDLISTDSH